MNLCPVCDNPLRRSTSIAHRHCWDILKKMKRESIKPIDRNYFKYQIQNGFAWDENSVLL